MFNIYMKKLLGIIVLGLLLSGNANSESKAIKLVCIDPNDKSFPLYIEIHNYGSTRFAALGDILLNLEVSDVMYTLTKNDDKVNIFGMIFRNDGTFKLDLAIGSGEPHPFRGSCKKGEKNKPLF